MPERSYSPKRVLIGLAVFALLVMIPFVRSGCATRAYEFGGTTMGTTYTVRLGVSHLRPGEVRDLQRQVVNLLTRLNHQMSTYDPDSEISVFNRFGGARPVVISPQFEQVTRTALAVATMTDGAFDPTVLPLVELWGFGPRPGENRRPTEAEIAAARDQVDYRGIEVGSRSISKRKGFLRLDLSAVAKGYAVDAVAELLRLRGAADVFVDIGGEIMAWGVSRPGQPWRVAIDTPTRSRDRTSPEYRRLELQDRAVATSGDYRNFFEEDGRAYTHVIDPRTGYPVSNQVASVSVLAPDCMTADALATAIMVLGAQDGLALVESLDATEALVILREADGGYAERVTSGFPL